MIASEMLTRATWGIPQGGNPVRWLAEWPETPKDMQHLAYIN